VVSNQTIKIKKTHAILKLCVIYSIHLSSILVGFHLYWDRRQKVLMTAQVERMAQVFINHSLLRGHRFYVNYLQKWHMD